MFCRFYLLISRSILYVTLRKVIQYLYVFCRAIEANELAKRKDPKDAKRRDAM